MNFTKRLSAMAMCGALLTAMAPDALAEPVDGPWTNAVGQGNGPIFDDNTNSPTVGDVSPNSASMEMLDSPFTPIFLSAPGDKIVFQGRATVVGTGDAPPHVGAPRIQFRFGLFLSDADDFGWVGYFMSNKHGNPGPPSGMLARKPVGNVSPYMSIGGANALATEGGDGSPFSLFHDATYAMNLTIERGGADELLISSSLIGSNDFMQSMNAIDVSAGAFGTFAFDSVGLLLGNNLGADQVLYKNLRVRYIPAPIPEPGSLALGMIAACLAGGRWSAVRRRRVT